MSEPRNRVVQVRRFGGPDELEVIDVPMPSAGRGEVRVRVLASGIEYTDAVIRRHAYAQTMFLRPPFVMGYDVVGEIDQLGDERVPSSRALPSGFPSRRWPKRIAEATIRSTLVSVRYRILVYAQATVRRLTLAVIGPFLGYVPMT